MIVISWALENILIFPQTAEGDPTVVRLEAP